MKKVLKKEIINELEKDNLCILPTDTVYGLMARLSKENEERLNIFKKRDKDQKISIIFSSTEELLKYIDNLDDERINLIKDKLPGKYTFVVDLKKDFCQKYGFDRTDFGVRVTSNKYLQNILSITGPVLATSCNYTKEDICVSLTDIEKIFNNIDIPVYYKGKGTNTPSSIIKINEETISILR